MQPASVSSVNRQKGIRATPAGSEMKVRMTGIIREKKTVASPCRVEPVVGPLEVAAVRVEDPVALDQLEAAVVADRVGDP